MAVSAPRWRPLEAARRVAVAPTQERARELEELRRALRLALRALAPRERRILIRRFGLGGEAPATRAAIAADLGIGRERVAQLEARACRKLCARSPGRRLLRPFAESMLGWAPPPARVAPGTPDAPPVTATAPALESVYFGRATRALALAAEAAAGVAYRSVFEAWARELAAAPVAYLRIRRADGTIVRIPLYASIVKAEAP